MMKRTPNSGNLPVTTNDSSQTKSVAKTPKPNRRRSAGKGSVLIRIIAGILLFFVASIYILGTRYVLLTSPSDSYTPGGNINNILYHGTEDSYISKNHRNSFTESRGRQLQSFAEKPRVVGHYYTLPDSESYFGTERIDPNLKRLYDNTQSKINRGAFMTEDEVESQEHLLDSRSYDNNAADPLSHQGKDCVAQYDWQETSFPSCNILMEVDITNLNLLPMFHEEHYNNKHDLPLASSWLHSYSKLIANGHWRDVWRIENLLRHNGKQEETFILKTMRYRHDYVPRNYDRHRRDAIVMERLSGSKFIMDIYAACGNSGLFQFADGGDLEQSMWYQRHRDKKSDEKPWSPEEKMIIAYQAVSGLVDLHNFAKAGVPAVAHTDIGPNQYVYVEEEGLYKLNDFNRARFMAKHNNTSELCTYRVGNNPGKVSAKPSSAPF